MKKNKYIIVHASKEPIAAPHVVLFDNWLWHEAFANRDVDIRSAGYFEIIWKGNDFDVRCYDESLALKKGPFPTDEKLIKNFLLR